MAKRLGCKIRSTCPLAVSVAGGKDMVTVSMCKDFQWQLYGQNFTTDMMLIPFGGCDTVLGIQWLSTLGNIKCNFKELKMQFLYNNTKEIHLGIFDDILIYIKSLEDHVIHLKVVLSKMKAHSLYAKDSKCMFGTTRVEYLGHVILAEGVATDSSKVQAMQTWHIPKTLKQLKVFLGLTGYYIRFIKDFASISKTLTQLLKKNSFKWSDEAQQSFLLLKEAMIKALILGLPNFNKLFIVETNASGVGLGAALQQDGHPIAYINQRISTPTQMKWLPKLMGYDYEVIYKQGKDNAVADALSRRGDVGELLAMSTTSMCTELYDRVVQSWLENDHLQTIIADLKKGEARKHYALWVKATTHKICSVFYWKGLRNQVKQWVKIAKIVKRNNAIAVYGLVQWRNGNPQDAT
nr:gypsy/Ty3 retroelement polyprotein [Tanacetum cinerariifolium]